MDAVSVVGFVGSFWDVEDACSFPISRAFVSRRLFILWHCCSSFWRRVSSVVSADSELVFGSPCVFGTVDELGVLLTNFLGFFRSFAGIVGLIASPAFERGSFFSVVGVSSISSILGCGVCVLTFLGRLGPVSEFAVVDIVDLLIEFECGRDLISVTSVH